MPIKKNLYVLVGPPSVGKSTWVLTNLVGSSFELISRDNIVDEIADENNLTYDDLFSSPTPDEKLGDVNKKFGQVVKSPSYIRNPLSYEKLLTLNKTINDKLNEKKKQAVMSNKDIVVDMTNMTVNARKSAVAIISGKEDLYNKIAVVFNFKGKEDKIKDLSKQRSIELQKKGKSKTINEQVFKNMFDSFQDVTDAEGFDQIIRINGEHLEK
jgi:hypothetical protein